MDEQDKKPLDVENMSDEECENMSDEELEEIAGGVILPKQRAERAEFLKNGGTQREWLIHTLRQGTWRQGMKK